MSATVDARLDMLAAALGYARLGMHVFPCWWPRADGTCACGDRQCQDIGKHPIGRPGMAPNGLLNATTDEAVIRAWWRKVPSANVAIRTGKESGIVALDVDPRHGGDESLQQLQAKHGPLPETVESLTGGGGSHPLFKYPGEDIKNKTALAEGLDVRGDGGFIIAPPSLHKSSRRYAWDVMHEPADTPFAEIPAWLLAMLREPSRKNGTTLIAKDNVDVEGTMAGVPEGQRDDKLWRLACSFRGSNLPRAFADKAIVEAADSCRPPFSQKEALDKVARAYARYQPREARTHAEAPPQIDPETGEFLDGGAIPDDRPLLDAGEKDLPVIRAAVWASIRRVNDPQPTLFRHGGILSRLERDDGDTPTLRELTADRLRHVLGNVGSWYKEQTSRDRESKGSSQVQALPPLHVVHDMLADPEPPLPILTRIVEAPVFAPSGELETGSGYHAAGKTYYAPAEGLQIPAVDAQPSAEQLALAKRLVLDELLGDFPFAEQADRANALGLILLPYARDLVQGCTPLHMIEAPTPGSGKGLLADVALRLATGRAPAAMVPPEDDDEWRKRLTTQIRLAPMAVLIDNITRVLDSASLASMLTATTWADRLLGSNELLRLPVRCVWVATANNPTMSTEIARRCVRIRLTPPTDKPWEREPAEFQHPKLVEWVDEKRDALVWACLTLVQAWIAAGRPAGTLTVGTFEHWASVVGGILEVAGVPGFLENRNEFYEAADTEGATLRQLVAQWHEHFGTRPVTSSELFPYALLVGIDLGDSVSERSQRTALGMFLGKQRERVIGDYRIHQAGKSQGASRWRLMPLRDLLEQDEPQ